MAQSMDGAQKQETQAGHKLNRKITKIEFLSQENQQLKEQVLELQNIIKLNKEALKIAMQPSTDNIQNSNFNNKNSFQNSNNASTNDNSKALTLILNAMYQENESLIKINEKLAEERNIAQSKALINEQISEASQKHEKELIQDLEEKVMNLSKKVKEQEQQIYSYEKIRPDYDEISGIVIKYRDVININDQTIRLHDENERLNMIILKLTRENNSIKSDKQDLVKINMQMSNEILRLKAALAAPHGRSAYTANTNTNLALIDEAAKGKQLIKIHRKLMKNDNSDEEDQDDEDDMESEIDVLPEKATLYTEIGTTSTNPKPGLVIPKLDLAKALKIQEINAKKSTMQQLQKQQGSDIGAVCQQLKRVEGDLTIAKKNLQREMLLNKTLQIENENLKRFNVELESRNETLVASSQMYEEKWQKVFQAFQFYRDYYKKTISQNQQNSQNQQIQRSNRSQNKGDKSMIGIDILNSSSYTTTHNRYLSYNGNTLVQNANINDSQLNMDPDKLLTSKMISRKELANQKNTDQKSILELNNNEINLDEEIYKIDPLSQKEYAKNYILNIAKEVYGIFNKQRHSNLSPKKSKGKNTVQNEYRLKRSLSNPLDYMNDQGKEMIIQSNYQNLDRSDIGAGLRNFTTQVGNDQIESHSQQKYKELNDVINNQEILIQFTEQTDDKYSNNLTGHTPVKPKQLND
ncbi:hypothetical protein ABPG72_014856 [Tetrahymena utriculariae]